MAVLTCVFSSLSVSFSDLLLLHSWCYKTLKILLKKKLILLLVRNPQMKEMNVHSANTAVLCFELCCGVFPYLESSLWKERCVFI